jgi:thiol-disulfide isomerase/thioredoxin
MISRRKFLISGLVASALIASSVAFAGERIDYSPAAFDAAQKAGRSILVEIHAPWCPTCRAQAPILSQLESQAKFKDLLVVHVDFDSQKDAVRRFGARMQSTLITFKGAAETPRSVGDTNPGSIGALLEKSI